MKKTISFQGPLSDNDINVGLAAFKKQLLTFQTQYCALRCHLTEAERAELFKAIREQIFEDQLDDVFEKKVEDILSLGMPIWTVLVQVLIDTDDKTYSKFKESFYRIFLSKCLDEECLLTDCLRWDIERSLACFDLIKPLDEFSDGGFSTFKEQLVTFTGKYIRERCTLSPQKQDHLFTAIRHQLFDGLVDAVFYAKMDLIFGSENLESLYSMSTVFPERLFDCLIGKNEDGSLREDGSYSDAKLYFYKKIKDLPSFAGFEPEKQNQLLTLIKKLEEASEPMGVEALDETGLDPVS